MLGQTHGMLVRGGDVDITAVVKLCLYLGEFMCWEREELLEVKC